MNYTVSFTDFRKNISKFSDMANAGNPVVVNNGKRGIPLFKIVRADDDSTDWDEHLLWMKNFKPFLTEKSVSDMKKFRRSFNKRFSDRLKQ